MSATLVATGLAGGHGHRTLIDSLDLSVAPGDVVGAVVPVVRASSPCCASLAATSHRVPVQGSWLAFSHVMGGGRGGGRPSSPLALAGSPPQNSGHGMAGLLPLGAGNRPSSSNWAQRSARASTSPAPGNPTSCCGS